MTDLWRLIVFPSLERLSDTMPNNKNKQKVRKNSSAIKTVASGRRECNKALFSLSFLLPEGHNSRLGNSWWFIISSGGKSFRGIFTRRNIFAKLKLITTEEVTIEGIHLCSQDICEPIIACNDKLFFIAALNVNYFIFSLRCWWIYNYEKWMLGERK